jgi:hypothetical protein
MFNRWLDKVGRFFSQPLGRKQVCLISGLPVFAIVVFFVVNPVCGCGHGRVYHEIKLAEVPPQVIQQALSKHHGATTTRAWTTREEDQFEGYLIRLRTGLLWWDDVRIDSTSDEAPRELEPIVPR